ncbi:hypothetical protein BROUX41_003366 [Berkeleyomyces rouxiae]
MPSLAFGYISTLRLSSASNFRSWKVNTPNHNSHSVNTPHNILVSSRSEFSQVSLHTRSPSERRATTIAAVLGCLAVLIAASIIVLVIFSNNKTVSSKSSSRAKASKQIKSRASHRRRNDSRRLREIHRAVRQTEPGIYHGPTCFPELPHSVILASPGDWTMNQAYMGNYAFQEIYPQQRSHLEPVQLVFIPEPPECAFPQELFQLTEPVVISVGKVNRKYPFQKTTKYTTHQDTNEYIRQYQWYNFNANHPRYSFESDQGYRNQQRNHDRAFFASPYMENDVETIRIVEPPDEEADLSTERQKPGQNGASTTPLKTKESTQPKLLEIVDDEDLYPHVFHEITWKPTDKTNKKTKKNKGDTPSQTSSRSSKKISSSSRSHSKPRKTTDMSLFCLRLWFGPLKSKGNKGGW